MTFAELKAAVRTQAGIDADDATVGGWVNDRHRAMVARARWLMEELAIGTTVADQERYAISDEIVDLEQVLIGSAPYQRASTAQLYKLKYGTLAIPSNFDFGGVYAPTFSAGGVESIGFYPAPTTTGDAITGLAAVLPPALVNATDVPGVPEDLHEYLRDGAVGVGMALIKERLSEADWYNIRFEAGVELLRRRKNSRVGSGPTQIQVKSVHW